MQKETKMQTRWLCSAKIKRNGNQKEVMGACKMQNAKLKNAKCKMQNVKLKMQNAK